MSLANYRLIDGARLALGMGALPNLLLPSTLLAFPTFRHLSAAPVSRSAPQMHDRDDHHGVGPRFIQNPVGISPEQTTTKVAIERRRQLAPLCDAIHCVSELGSKPLGRGQVALRVPSVCLQGLSICCLMEDD
jgi:hypothetical protein